MGKRFSSKVRPRRLVNGGYHTPDAPAVLKVAHFDASNSYRTRWRKFWDSVGKATGDFAWARRHVDPKLKAKRM